MNDYEDSEIWERLPDEPSRSYMQFAFYRDLGPMRSYKQVAENFKITRGTVGVKAYTWNWRARAHAYDANLDRLALTTKANSVKEMNERQLKMCKFLSTLAFSRFMKEWEQLPKKQDGQVDVEEADFNLTLNGAKALIEMVFQQERIAMGADKEQKTIPSNPVVIIDNLEDDKKGDEKNERV